MALKITTAADPVVVETLTTVIYAPPGVGKTSLAFTTSKPLLLDFDKGAHRAINRKDSVRIFSWEDVAGIAQEDLEPFDTVIIDTAGRALDILTVDIINRNPKLGRGGALNVAGFGELKARFIGFLSLVRSFGKDVVLLAHMDEQGHGEERVERLDVQGGSKNEIYKAADLMGRLIIVNRQRQLLFSPTDTSFGKNPGQLEPIAVPDASRPEFATLLADIISRTKERLNQETEAQREAAAEQEWFRKALPDVGTPQAVNELLERAKAGGVPCKALLKKRADELGLSFDKNLAIYVAPEPEEEAA